MQIFEYGDHDPTSSLDRVTVGLLLIFSMYQSWREYQRVRLNRDAIEQNLWPDAEEEERLSLTQVMQKTFSDSKLKFTLILGLSLLVYSCGIYPNLSRSLKDFYALENNDEIGLNAMEPISIFAIAPQLILNMLFLQRFVWPAILRSMHFVFSEIPDYVNQIRQNDFESIREQFTSYFYQAVRETQAQMVHFYHTAQETKTQAFNKANELAERINPFYHRFWYALGYHTKHNFNNMDTVDLKCIFTHCTPDPENAVIIFNDPTRQVYNKDDLECWMAKKKDTNGKAPNPITRLPFFSKKEIVPAPGIVKNKIREKNKPMTYQLSEISHALMYHWRF